MQKLKAKLSYKFFIWVSLVFLIFSRSGEIMGVLIYISLSIALIQLLLDRKAVVD